MPGIVAVAVVFWKWIVRSGRVAVQEKVQVVPLPWDWSTEPETPAQ